VAGIKGTTFVMEETGKQTTLKVIEGEVELTDKTKGITEKVRGGETLTADAGGLGVKTNFDLSVEEANWSLNNAENNENKGFETKPTQKIQWRLIVASYILAFIFGFTYRMILKKFAKNTTRGIVKNIGKPDRILRFGIGLGLLILAIITNWSLILFFFSGFAFFEAIFSWCGYYAAIGKNTCPLEA